MVVTSIGYFVTSIGYFVTLFIQLEAYILYFLLMVVVSAQLAKFSKFRPLSWSRGLDFRELPRTPSSSPVRDTVT